MQATSETSQLELEDIQNKRDHREIAIDKVGVKNIIYPVTVLDKEHGEQNTVASVDMYVSLPHHFKGTHMSRFVEVLNENRHGMSVQNFASILEKMRVKLDAVSAHMEMRFPYFAEKKAPVSGEESMMSYDCSFVGSIKNGEYDLQVGVTVPTTSVCPCSKAISEAGAHNQRSLVTLKVRFKEFVWIEDLIRLVEAKASCEVYSLLKRADEKYVTERAYDNPKFVEDIVRDVAQDLLADSNITWFSVESENFESIHNHNAYALVEKWRQPQKNKA